MAKLKTVQDVTEAALALEFDEKVQVFNTLKTEIKAEATTQKEKGEKAAEVLKNLEINGN